MRLWSLHPSLLDPKPLVALGREALLDQKVLQGKTTGYRSHWDLQEPNHRYSARHRYIVRHPLLVLASEMEL